MQSWAFGDGQAVGRMGFGAMRLTGQPGNFGPYPDKPHAERVFRRAYELGVNFIDTAISYGAGHSEMLIAELLRPYPNDLLIASKGGFLKLGPSEVRKAGSPAELRKACEESLGNLKIDCIDLYQLHIPDPAVPFADSIGTLAALRQEGKIRRIGLCNVSVAEVKAAQAIVPIESVQNKYNVGFRAGQDVVDYCAAEGIAFLPWGPLDGVSTAQGSPLAHAGGRLGQVAERLGVRANQVALAWLMSRGDHVIPIPGTTSIDHLEQNVAAAGIALSADDLAILNAGEA